MMKPRPIRLLLFACPVILMLSGCGTLPNGRAWGEDATLFPGLQKIRAAALRAVQSPATWIPATGALVFSLDHLDRRASDWASRKTPIFGSRGRAETASDYFLDAEVGGAVLTALAAPGGPEPGPKLKGLGVEFAAGSATLGVTELLKIGVARERPNGANNESFPSGHSSAAFAAAALGGENVDALPLSDGERIFLRTGFVALATGTAWARV